jgi:RNA polymerase sigma-70 factor (ECF subfamily)
MGSVASDSASQFSLLYERCYPAVYAYAARRVAAGAASEIAAETFLIAWRRLDVVPAEPLPWLYGVARNVVLRHRATVARQGQVEAAVAHERVAPADGSPDGGDPRLWEAWEQLRDGDREVLALVAWEELSVAQAARVLGCPAPVFSVRLHRAKRRLAQLLASPSNIPALAPSEVR